MVDVSTLVALGAAIAFVGAFLYYQNLNKKPTVKAVLGYTESELAALVSNKKPKKKNAPKEKKAVSPKTEKKAEVKPAPAASRRLKNVDGAADNDTDEAMLSFLSNKITLETKRKNADVETEEEKPKVKKGPKEAVVTEKPAAGFTAVVEKKKPAKKEADESAPTEEKAEEKKKVAKSFYKADADEEKKAYEARKAERAEREARIKLEKETGIKQPRPPRDPNAPPRPPRQQRDEETEEIGPDGERIRKPRDPNAGPSRPPRTFPVVAPQYTENFEEWSIDSILDAITASPAEKQQKRGKPAAPKAAVAAEEVAVEPVESTDA